MQILAANPDPRRDQSLELAKWLAVILMTACHGLMLGQHGNWQYVGYLLGRPAAPLFAGIIVLRLGQGSPARAQGYLLRLFAWGLLSQPIFHQMLILRPYSLDILLTLAAGVALWMMLDQRQWLLLVCAVIGLFFVGPSLDFGASLAVAMALAVPLARPYPMAAMLLVTMATIPGDVSPTVGPQEILIAVVSRLPALAVIHVCLTRSFSCPRLPTWMFYAFYPTHMAVLVMLFGPFSL